MIWIAIFLVLVIVFITFAAFSIRSGIFIRSVCHTSDGIPILTFDDGPHPVYTPQVLDILKKHDIKAVFFLIGKNVEKYPELALRIHNEGHRIGNHTYVHSPKNTFSGWTTYRDEIFKTNEIIKKVTGVIPVLFRPPYGVTNPSIARAIRNSGMTSMGWSLRTFDTVVRDPEKIILKIKSTLEQDTIVLMHDTNEVCIEVLESYLEGNGDRFKE